MLIKFKMLKKKGFSCFQMLRCCIWFNNILLARTVDIIKHMLTILKLQGLDVIFIMLINVKMPTLLSCS